MAKRVLAGLIVGLIWVASSAGAQELTPMEKALRALANKQKLQAAGTASPVTFTVQAATKGVPTPGVTASPSSVPAPADPALTLAAGTTPAAQADAFGVTSAAVDVPPTAVSDPIQLTGTSGVDDILLSWSNTTSAWSGFAGYQVLRSRNGADWTPLLTTPRTLANYQDLSVTAGTSYAYRVLTVDARGATLCVSEDIFAQLRPAVPPDVPTEVKTSVEEERVRVFWQPARQGSREIGGYVVWRTPASGGAERLLAVTPTARNEYYDEDLLPDEPYIYRVAAVDARGLTGPASAGTAGHARSRSRDSLVLLSTAYRGLGLRDTGFTGDLQFTYYIGTLYGEQDPDLSKLAVYLDPISLWLLSADLKYTLLTDPKWPVAAAVGARGALQLFAGQQSATSGTFTFSGKSTFQTLWGGYLSLSRSFGTWGIHASYLQGTIGDALTYLSKYMEPTATRNCFGFGIDFPIVRRMNASLEVLYPVDASLRSLQHPFLVNAHVDRLLNFDVAYLKWDQGWALLGYFNLRFTVFPGSDT